MIHVIRFFKNCSHFVNDTYWYFYLWIQECHLLSIYENVVNRMAEMKSASSPNTFSFCFKYSFLHVLNITFYFLSTTAKSIGFDPIIQLPSSGLSRNSSSQKAVVFNIDKFGAKGDGITDDSKVRILHSHKFSVLR